MLKAYAFDVFVWLIIGSLTAVVFFSLFKRSRIFIILLGVLLIIGSLPAAGMTGLSATGCCGASSPGILREAAAPAVLVAMLGAGIAILLYGIKQKKRN